MKISDPEKMRQAFMKWSYQHNIRMVIEWHNKLSIGINEGIDELRNLLNEEQDKKKKDNIKASIHYYENYLTDNLRNFTLIMHISNFEEISTLVCKQVKITILNKSSLSRFKNGWEKKLDKPVGDISAWSILKDAEQLRHSILHSSGRISLNKDSDKIRQIIKKYNLVEKLDRVYVTEDYLNKIKNSICYLVNDND